MTIPVDFRLGEIMRAQDLMTTARGAEHDGYAGIQVRESRHDALLQLAVAAAATESVRLTSAIAVAFARNPMSVAIAGADLATLSAGRFALGLGSQVRAHIERRFDMPWSRPAARMQEFVEAMRAVWHSWATGERLAFEGEFYRHTLMTPAFVPELPHGTPRVLVAAVGEAMTDVAGRVADGLLVHSFTTRRYLSETTLPRVRAAQRAAGRAGDAVEISGSVLVATGRTDSELAAATTGLRRQIGFYGSTPAYRPVLALHGWEDLADRLHELSRSDDPDRWTRMGDLVDDEVLTAVGVVGKADDLPALVRARVAGLWDRISLYPCADTDPALLAAVARELAGD